MEPSNIKRSKLVNIMLIMAIAVLCSKSTYANEPIKANINKQQITTKRESQCNFFSGKEAAAKLSAMNAINIICEDAVVKAKQIAELSKQKETKLLQSDPDFLEREESMEYTEEELKLLATVMYAEAGICDDKELYRVGNVVLNRVNDDSGQFEDTIKGVIYQEGQFTSVGGKQWNIGPTERELEIAKDVLEGARILPSNTYWFSKGHRYGDIYYKSDWHYFSGMEL